MPKLPASPSSVSRGKATEAMGAGGEVTMLRVADLCDRTGRTRRVEGADPGTDSLEPRGTERFDPLVSIKIGGGSVLGEASVQRDGGTPSVPLKRRHDRGRPEPTFAIPFVVPVGGLCSTGTA